MLKTIPLLFLLAVTQASPPGDSFYAASVVDTRTPASSIATLSPTVVASAVNDALRLLPDHRVLLAVSDIHALRTGRPAPAEVRFVHGEWEVTCDGKRAGALPPIPNFADAMTLLTTWAHSLPAAQPAEAVSFTEVDRLINAFDRDSLFRAMQLLPAPPSADAAVSARAASAAVRLNVQMADAFEVADEVRARALALLAVARADDERFGDEELALIASALRYDVEARAIASRLPAGSAAQIATGIVTPTTAMLDGSPLVAYLAAAKLADSSEAWEALAAFSQRLPDVALPALLYVTTFDGRLEAAQRVQQRLASRTSTSFARRHGSSMFDATLVRKCEEALFYSAVDQEHAFHYSARSDRSSAEQQVDALDPSDRQPGHDVRALLVATNATMWNAARGVRPSLAVSLTHVGAGARALLYTRIRDAGAEVEADATQVCAQLDTRPTQLAMAAEMAARMIEDPSRRDLWYTGVIALAPDIVRDGKRAWFYQLTGNLTGLRAMAVDRRSSTDERAIALEYIAEGGDVEFASREFPKLMEETAYAPFSAYAGFLNEHRQWKEKEAAARRGLELSETEGGIPEAYYASSLADALEEQGRYAEAWRVVKPRMGVWSANIISGAISLLQRLGRVAESDELAGQYLDRYPDTSSRVEYAIVLWRQRRFDEAAKLFDSKTTANNEAEWSKWMPEAFERHISDTPTAIAVFEALHRAGVSDELLVVIPRALVRKQPAIAVALMEKLRDRARPAGYGEEAAIAEFNARIASNDPKAMESLRAATKDDAVDSMLLALLRKGYYEAALHVGTDRPAVSQDERCLYLSLALIGAHAARDDPRFAALRRTLEAQPLTASAGSPQHAARYATGIIDLHEADRLATIPKGRSILDFVIGLQLAADGNYDAALPHILAASQRSRELSVPQALAIDLLMRWSNASAPWPEVARRRIL